MDDFFMHYRNLSKFKPLLSQGYEVTGVFMRNWDEKDEKGHCTGDADAEDAEWVCRKLDIPFHEVNFVKEYWNDVFMYLLEEYKAGFTPNPDIMCNKRVKFSTFLKYAQENHNAEVIATGHYARSSFGEDLENYDVRKGARLLQSFDRIKDQTFFLSQIPQQSLQHTIFPIGECSKYLVRKIADTASLSRVAEKRDSTGICFIGTRKFQEFITEYIENKPGNFIDLETQQVVGTHQGIHQWTVGQRCKLSPFPLPYYVCEKHVESNNIFVVSGTDHPALFTSIFFTEPVFWIHSPPPQLYSQGQLECHFRFQNTAPLTPCVITSDGSNPWHLSPTQNNMVVSLAKPLRAITPGQFAVFYLGEECLGSARILRPGPSSYTLNVNNCRDIIQGKKLMDPK
ncbi:mitochondrial tRNA-specific 2-thiouridylase 1-like isoform X2 [Eriocheir sinensis]|uniref:mitochondrial tRNA-specific 2-thiouridylase 1-like isoform X2 n=1 Tax=Eriocheir sinensis TaxID=95602 RepID=UPI0021C894F9|nr:mitochondrial tRNA-specific 2-thiouridylase 1-like isoform X2 [Eriocheir sinensis]